MLKQRAKSVLLKRLHAREEIVSRLASKVSGNGIPRFLSWSYDEERASVLGYVNSLCVNRFNYRFAASVAEPVLYNSLYAFMLRGMFGALEHDAETDAWIDHFDRHQSKDGFFRDDQLAGPAFEGEGDWGDGWGVRHLAAHMTIPYARAKRRPLHEFSFLEPFYDPAYVVDWMDRFDLDGGVWSQSNYIMNLFTLLQFSRDHMGNARATPALECIRENLLARQNSATGLWHTRPLATRAELNDAIRGAYHFYPLFIYDGLEVPYQIKIIDSILPTQNSWGAFEEEDRPSGACEDIDAVDPLIRFTLATNHRVNEVKITVARALIWALACKNTDGGSVSLLENGCHYGGHPSMTSAPSESNLFATWFRTLATAYMTQFLGMKQSYSIGRFPGYEIALISSEGIHS